MAEITKELGRIPVSRGDYQATTEYYKDNIVQYKKGSYQVVSESPIIGIPPINDKNIVNPGWTLFAGALDAQSVDDVPTIGSDNLVKSGGVYSNNINRPSKTIISNLIGETGKYIRNDGVVIENPVYNISPIINLESGERIDVTCFAYQGNVAAISEYKNGVYYPIRGGDENVVKTYSYINLTDTTKYIVLSYENEFAYSAAIYSSETTSKLAVLKNTVIDDLPTIDSINGAKSDSVAKIEKVSGVELQDVDFTTSTGYITQSGSFVENPTYSHTSLIELGVGDTIIVKAACYPGNVCKLAKVVNNTYIPIINPSVHEFTYSYYTNNELLPINVVISYDNSLGVVIQKVLNQPLLSFDGLIHDTFLKPIKGVVDKLSIIKDWGFIGDSHMSGACQYMRIDGTIISDNYFAYSWGQLMCSRCNTVGTNWSYGGMTAKDWINKYWNGRYAGYKTGSGEEIFETNPKKVYVICLGTNDSYSSISIGSFDDVDVSDFNNNADTFYGNYCGIIQRIKYIQPSAKIFIVNIPTIFSTHERISQINDAILDISSRFTNLFFVDLLNLIPNNSEIMSKYALNNHLTLNGYLWISYVIGDIMNNIISNNLHAFDSLPMIGTSNDNGTL